VLGTIKSTPIAVQNVESSCPLLPIRYRWITGKFILKCSSLLNTPIIDIFNSINFKWRFVQRFTPLLSSMIQIFLTDFPHIYNVHKQPFYDINFDALILTSDAIVSPNFLGHTPNDFAIGELIPEIYFMY
jgi:hypothetical protein